MEDIKSLFFQQFSQIGDELKKDDGKNKPATVFCDTARQIYFWLVPEQNETLFRLDFWIDTYADNRNKRQDELRKIIKEHIWKYELVSYYSALGCRLRTRITNKDNLLEELNNIRKVVRWIAEPGAPNQVGGLYNLPVGLSTGVPVWELLKERLSVPSYQRGYCWDKKSVIGLLNDISRWKGIDVKRPYRIGTVILKKRACNKGFDIIDGQQRLTTLAMCMHELKINQSQDFFVGSTVDDKVKYAMGQALSAIRSFFARHEDVKNAFLDNVEVSAIVIGEDASDDLAFLFFNHINSSGKRLTDYELLKSHHLRYVNSYGDVVANKMADRWHRLENSGKQTILLHKCLYRIRRWLEGGWFSPFADVTEGRALFHEFSLDFEPVCELVTHCRPTNIASILSGGLEFFDYVEFHRERFEQFSSMPDVCALHALENESNGVLHDGILALSYMFYVTFGDLYLKYAIYIIAYRVSILRNETRIQRDDIGSSEFSRVAKLISRVTSEGEFFGKMLSDDVYVPTNKGPTAKRYWEKLKVVMKVMQPTLEGWRSFLDSLEIDAKEA